MMKYRYLVLGILLGLSLGFIIGRQYGMRVQEKVDQLQQSPHQVEVIAANKDIQEGDVLKRTDLALMNVPEGVVSNPVSLQDVDRVIGHKTLNRLEAGQSLHWSDIEGRSGTDR